MGFSDVDNTANPEAYVRFLDQRAATDFFIQNRAARVQHLDLRDGDRVLEIGAGTGEFTRDLRAALGPAGSVVGLDLSAVMLAAARARSRPSAPHAATWQPNYCLADACRLPFATASFDACTCERVIFHLADPAQAVAELARVSRPGARVVLFEPDWSTMRMHGPDPAITRRVIDIYVGRLANPGAARALPDLLAASGFEHITVAHAEHTRTERSAEGDTAGSGMRAVIAAGVRTGALTRDEATAWGASVREAEAAGRYRFSLMFLMVSAGRSAG